jgi:hypothetical protein
MDRRPESLDLFASWCRERRVIKNGSPLQDDLKPGVDLTDDEALKRAARQCTPGFLSRSGQEPVFGKAKCGICGHKLGKATAPRRKFLEYLESHLRLSRNCQSLRTQRSIVVGASTSHWLHGEETIESKEIQDMETKLRNLDHKFWHLLSRWRHYLDVDTLKHWSEYCYEDVDSCEHKVCRLESTMSRLSGMGYLPYGPIRSPEDQEDHDLSSIQEAMSLETWWAGWNYDSTWSSAPWDEGHASTFWKHDCRNPTQEVLHATQENRLESRRRIVNRSLPHTGGSPPDSRAHNG